MPKLLIDGNHLTGRTWATLGDLTTSQGEHSGILMGFLKSLQWAKKEAQAEMDDVLVCWDAGRSAKRMELYPDYKGGRVPKIPTEEDEYRRQQYINQINELTKVLEFLGCKQVRVGGAEADDLIGIFASHFSKWDTVLIHSGDKDMHQLVNQRISIFDPKHGIQDERAILNKWSLTSTEQIIYYKALTGDKSDNIGGVGGIGEVWALRLLKVLQVKDDKIEWCGEIDAALQKKIALVDSRLDIMKRNLLLMRIPKSWEESFYTVDQQVLALEQVLRSGRNRSDIEAMKFLKRWELDSVIQHFGRF